MQPNDPTQPNQAPQSPETPQPQAAQPSPTPPQPAPVVSSPTQGEVVLPPSKKKKFVKPLLIVLAVLVLLGAGSAAAYYGIVVPNKPENVLKAAVENTLQQKEIKTKGQLDIEPTGSDTGLATKIAFESQSDATDKAVSAKIDVTVSGVNVPLEARYIDKNAYVRAGDLTQLKTFVTSLSPEAGPIADAVSKQLSKQWIVIDSTLIKQAGAECALDTNWSLTEDDMQLLKDAYAKNQFATIDSSAQDTVDGKKLTKFVITLDNKKLSKYAEGLNDLSLVKNLQKCDQSKEAGDTATDELKNNDKTTFTLWVDKSSKEIVRLAAKTDAQDEKTTNAKVALTMNLSYGSVSVDKPADAKPVMQVWAELQNALGTDIANLGGFIGSTDLQVTE